MDTFEYSTIVAKMIELQTYRQPTPVKYLNRHGEGLDLYHKDYFNCPRCGRRLRNKQHDKFCGSCGQALDWEYGEENK